MPTSEESSRRRVQRLAASGHYVLAEEAVRTARVQREMALTAATKQLERDNAHQWNSLQVASNRYLLQHQSAAIEEERAHWERLLRAQAERSEATEEELVRFARAETAKLNSMPMAVPREVLAVQQQEKKMRLEGSFAELAQLRDESIQLQETLFNASIAKRRNLLNHRVTRQAIRLLTRDALVQEKDNDNFVALQVKHARQHDHIAAQLSHIKEGMLAAQRKEHRQIQGTGSCNRVVNANYGKALRGTSLERRVYGDAYRLPSLCKLYGPLMEGRLPALPSP